MINWLKSLFKRKDDIKVGDYVKIIKCDYSEDTSDVLKSKSFKVVEVIDVNFICVEWRWSYAETIDKIALGRPECDWVKVTGFKTYDK